VHGDLRDANLMGDGDTMLLVDFDWGGMAGEVFYPTANLNPELPVGRESTDLKITKGDDIRVLALNTQKAQAVGFYVMRLHTCISRFRFVTH